MLDNANLTSQGLDNAGLVFCRLASGSAEPAPQQCMEPSKCHT